MGVRLGLGPKLHQLFPPPTSVPLVPAEFVIVVVGPLRFLTIV